MTSKCIDLLADWSAAVDAAPAAALVASNKAAAGSAARKVASAARHVAGALAVVGEAEALSSTQAAQLAAQVGQVEADVGTARAAVRVCVWFPCASFQANHAYSTVILFGLCSQLATVNLQWGDVATDVAALGSTAAAASTSASTTLGSTALPQPAAVVNVTTSDYASVFRLRTVPTSMQVSVITSLHTNTTTTAP